MRYFVLVLFFAGILFGAGAFAEPPQIIPSKEQYHYGQYLTVTIKVSNVSGPDAVMHIVDSKGTKSNPIPIRIDNKTTIITAQSPFHSELFAEGSYRIELDYNREKAYAEFVLADAGNAVMPFGSNLVVPQWTGGLVSDHTFLKFLSDKGTVRLSAKISENAKIPGWYKTPAAWWSEKKISDEEFIKGIQYLVGKKIILP